MREEWEVEPVLRIERGERRGEGLDGRPGLKGMVEGLSRRDNDARDDAEGLWHLKRVSARNRASTESERTVPPLSSFSCTTATHALYPTLRSGNRIFHMLSMLPGTSRSILRIIEMVGRAGAEGPRGR